MRCNYADQNLEPAGTIYEPSQNLHCTQIRVRKGSVHMLNYDSAILRAGRTLRHFHVPFED